MEGFTRAEENALAICDASVETDGASASMEREKWQVRDEIKLTYFHPYSLLKFHIHPRTFIQRQI